MGFISMPSGRAGSVVPETPAPTADWKTTASLSGGWRTDHVRWKIQFPDSGATGSSVLAWSEMHSLTTGVRLETLYQDHLYLRATGSFGGAVSGNNADTDYLGSYQYSKSVSGAAGSTFWETSLAVGWKFRILNDRLTLTPLLGLQYNYAWLRIRGGSFTDGESEGESLSDLNSSYRPNVLNGFIGESLEWTPTPWLRLTSGLQFGLGYYYARAQWILRDDFAQPLSFVHRGLAWTIEGDVAAEVLLTRHWSAFTRFYCRGSMVTNGQDRTQFSDGSSAITELTTVTWVTLGVDLGIGFRF